MMWLAASFRQLNPRAQLNLPLGRDCVAMVILSRRIPTVISSVARNLRSLTFVRDDNRTFRDCDTVSAKGERKRGWIPSSAWKDFLAFFFALSFLWAPPLRAHDSRPAALQSVDLVQNLGSQVPLDAEFRDEAGRTVRLKDYFGRRPVILSLVYFSCQDLCPLTSAGLVRSLRPLSFSIGNEFDVLTVSFDARDTPALAAAKKSDALQQYARPGAAEGWHFLTGHETAIQRLAETVGFRYNYESDRDRFGHAAGIMLLTPTGKVARYFYGIEFSPRDLRLGLIEASANKIGSPIDQLLLFCYHYDPATGKYSLLITNIIRLAAAATVVALGAFIGLMLRRDRNRKLEPRESA
jgi:protein SCO1